MANETTTTRENSKPETISSDERSSDRQSADRQNAELQAREDAGASTPTIEIPLTDDLKILSFEDWGLDADLRKALDEMGYERPMPVQDAVFKILTAGNDLMVQSKTGSGKTAAFGIPIAQLLASGEKGVQSLILAPTRELALQVAKEIERLTTHMDVSVVPVYGGAPIGPQISKLKAGAQIVAGTPGRVLDHIRRKTLDTSGIRMLVLDECDEMLSMGFQEEIENIISYLPAKENRQTLLFSATIPKEIERIARRHMRDPEMLSLSSDSVGAELIDHYYYVVSGMARTRDLLKLMKAERPESAIIFCNTREETNSVARYLQRHGYDAEPLSSDLSQHDRERVMGRMRAKNLSFLVATDIAARGIDISELSHVINFTFPSSPEIYVHRTGRTGRAGKQGTALSLVGPREIGAFYYLKLIYKIIPTERDLPTADEMATIEEGEQYEKIVKMLDGKPGSEYFGLARRLWQSKEGERVVALLLQDLLTRERTEPKATTTTSSAAPTAVREPSPIIEMEVPEVAADSRERDTSRRRRRRNRGDEAGQPVSASADVAALDVEQARDVELVDPAIEVLPVEAVPPEAAASEPTTEETEAEGARRKRRRRRRSEEPRADSREDAPREQLDVASTPHVEDTEADVEEIAAPVAETEAEPEELAAPVEAAPTGESSERPRRKRRRRRGAAADSESESDGAEQALDAAVTKTAATAVGGESDVEAKKSKASKRRPRKPKLDAGTHGEFWEAWADSKSSNGAADSDDDTTQDEAANVKTTARASEPKSERTETRKRRRPSKRDASESMDASDAEEDPRSESGNGVAKDGDSVRLFVNVGKREDADADEIRAFIEEAMGDKAEGLGRITLRNTHCYLRVTSDIADEVIEACTGLLFKEREMVVERAKR
jgi:ATP-dependent RNA helicase DeaD